MKNASRKAGEKMRHLIGISDKTAHCIARMLQQKEHNIAEVCLYCKYAPECSKEFMRGKRSANRMSDITFEIQRRTSVRIYPSTQKGPNITMLEGSWLQEHPELMQEFTNMSFEEQLDMLRSSYILQHIHSQHS